VNVKKVKPTVPVDLPIWWGNEILEALQRKKGVVVYRDKTQQKVFPRKPKKP